MKFVANLEYVSGYLRSGSLHGTIPDGIDITTLTKAELHELLFDCGTIVIDDYRLEDCGSIDHIQWENV